MTYDPLRRDSTWTMFKPGCYLDPAGRAHLFPDELIAHLQRTFPEVGFQMSDRELVVATFLRALRGVHPEIKVYFVEHVRQAS